LNSLLQDLERLADPEKAKHSARFFKTGKGEYGYGDKFLGIVVPEQRKIAKKYCRNICLEDVQRLLDSEAHEHRLTGLFILVYKFQRADEKCKQIIYRFYIKNFKTVNNWDLVDSSAHKIIGAYMHECPKEKLKLKVWAKSKNLWKRRIAMISCFAFTDRSEFDDALEIAEMLVYDDHDLIHKAVGWVLREIGKKDINIEKKFLDKYAATMPRTMLRYAIEKFDEKERQHYLKMKNALKIAQS